MPDGSVLKCPAAVAELEQVLVNVEIPALKRWVHVKLDPQAVNPSTSIAASITQTESLLLGISRSAESSLKHSLLLTALPKVMSGHAVTVADLRRWPPPWLVLREILPVKSTTARWQRWPRRFAEDPETLWNLW